jgi:hypothetical protein
VKLELVPLLADKGCYVVSVTDPYIFDLASYNQLVEETAPLFAASTRVRNETCGKGNNIFLRSEHTSFLQK